MPSRLWSHLPAHEEDAERAVRAGLELIAAVTASKSPVPLQTRVGIATGLVVVGDLIGAGASQEQAIVGETPNLATRLQGIAEPNRVIIAEGTRRLLGNLFGLEDLGPKELVRAFAALRPASVEGRFEALHASGVTGELLRRLFRAARAARGRHYVTEVESETTIRAAFFWRGGIGWTSQ